MNDDGLRNYLFDVLLEHFPKLAPDEIATSIKTASKIIGLQDEANVNNELDSGTFSGDNTASGREAFANGMSSHELSLPEQGDAVTSADPDIDGYVKRYSFSCTDYEFSVSPIVEERKTYKIMHSPKQETSGDFSFEILNKDAERGDVFDSLKANWLVWVYTDKVLLCDANAFYQEIDRVYPADSDTLLELGAAHDEFVNAVSAAASAGKSVDSVIQKYSNALGDFANYVVANGGKLGRGDNGEFTISISPEVICNKFPVNEYTMLKSVISTIDNPDIDEVRADRKAKDQLDKDMRKNTFRWYDALLQKIVNGTYCNDSEIEFDGAHLRKTKSGAWRNPVEGPRHWARRIDILNKLGTFGRVIRTGPLFQLIKRLPAALKNKPNNYAGITDLGILFVIGDGFDAENQGKKVLYTFYHWNNKTTDTPLENLQRFLGDTGVEDVDGLNPDDPLKFTKNAVLNIARPKTSKKANGKDPLVNPLPRSSVRKLLSTMKLFP